MAVIDGNFPEMVIHEKWASISLLSDYSTANWQKHPEDHLLVQNHSVQKFYVKWILCCYKHSNSSVFSRMAEQNCCSEFVIGMHNYPLVWRLSSQQLLVFPKLPVFAFYSSDGQSRTFLPSSGHLAISGNIFVVNNPKRGATGHTVDRGKGCERYPTNNKNWPVP